MYNYKFFKAFPFIHFDQLDRKGRYTVFNGLKNVVSFLRAFFRLSKYNINHIITLLEFLDVYMYL